MRSVHTVAIVQARMGSTRLPGKVMKPIAGEPMIHHVVERTRRIRGVDQVVVATSDAPGERPLVEWVCSAEGVELFRGPEHDVLRRYHDAALAYNAEVVVRITGDCPLLSPRVSTQVVQTYLEHRTSCDYCTNTLQRTYPRGLDTAAMSFEVLRRAHLQAAEPAAREHVTVYIWSNPDRFRLLGVRDHQDRHHLRWTVDTAADLQLIRKIYDALSPNSLFEYDQVLELLEQNPQWTDINADVRQKSVGSG